MIRRAGVLIIGVLLTACLIPAATARAWEWVPTDEEIRKYRKSWNPLSEGPLLIQSVDIHPKGQLSIRPFVFSQVSEKGYGNTLSLPNNRKDGPVHTYSVAPLVVLTYGLTNHVELGVATSWQAFWTKDSDSFNKGRGGPWTTDTGMGDVSLQMKYRPIVQDPDSARPSITLYQQLVLPTSRWVTGTERPPGGFAPLGRLPATRFGELSLTEGMTFRKNFQPFRISGGLFYTYATSGSDAGQTTYTGDVINTRLSFEHFLDDKQGFAYNIELTTVSAATWRADGHSINRGSPSGSTVIGMEPAVQWRFSDSWVAAAGVLFTVAGQNTADAIYPNFAFRWFWNQGKKAQMP
ncbi:MAG: hypothetical protein A3H49_09485 [Nitrospirae bacterium RIFCSPLOWO2_02_FULL_62_14]|nr:MAG: hypothetical protein A3H49_09485 [Nitrospirae bacterium RIFCSPLOWO2_02_FULL_62_14]